MGNIAQIKPLNQNFILNSQFKEHALHNMLCLSSTILHDCKVTSNGDNAWLRLKAAALIHNCGWTITYHSLRAPSWCPITLFLMPNSGTPNSSFIDVHKPPRKQN